MKNSISRRQFVARSCGLLAGAGVASRLLEAAASEAEHPAILVTCRDGHLRVAGKNDCWSALAKLGAQGVEVSVAEDLSLPGLFHPTRKYTVATAEGIEQVVADMKAANRPITALCMANRFDARPEFELEWATTTAKAAKAIGAKAIRIDVWPQKLPAAKFLAFATEMLKKLIDATESTGVAFGIENHGGTTNDPKFLNALFEAVGSPRLGLTLDTGNFYWYGHPLSKVHEFFQAFASRVFHTHCKSIRFPESEREKKRPMGWKYAQYNCPVDEGDIDFRRLVGIFKKAGYANDLCIEDESLGKYPASRQSEIIARELRFLKGLL
jgi:sugar phosphate isomerase/epimerase